MRARDSVVTVARDPRHVASIIIVAARYVLIVSSEQQHTAIAEQIYYGQFVEVSVLSHGERRLEVQFAASFSAGSRRSQWSCRCSRCTLSRRIDVHRVGVQNRVIVQRYNLPVLLDDRDSSDGQTLTLEDVNVQMALLRCPVFQQDQDYQVVAHSLIETVEGPVDDFNAIAKADPASGHVAGEDGAA
ncbi:unnamed protein product [Trichogramma brassicae]|uniref:Uncharacterized protein n=1 Tax=Trichogramma brassicae TaxID=86971 RepID=A0A6H5I7F7_9HYME|nr:unnamed protein product [Trichogramma brassicae]CAB0033316.1 unnamed protein product [Trichogramma brassicae]CAB0033317.1 unnamed protein product [Trichogramma brassicae]CAB0033319.1 unnamed protein product [Trichogramma brassicae]